jgi:Uma2 family endonuclease
LDPSSILGASINDGRSSRRGARCDNIAGRTGCYFLLRPARLQGVDEMSTSTMLMTADELFAMPHEGFRYELVRGELRKMSPAGGEHGAIIVNITLFLAQHVKANDLGVCFGAETGFRLASDPDTVRAPDVAFVRRERIPESGIPKKFWPGAPDLAVEVLSPDDTPKGAEEKAGQWLASGAGAVWVVNPKRRDVSVYRPASEVLRLSEAEELEGQDVVPGFRCKVAEIFV